MYRLESVRPRSTLEEMLDLFRTGDAGDVEGENGGGDETRPPPLPMRPTSRARLPSSVRTRKAQNGAAGKGLSVNVIKEEAGKDSGGEKIESPTFRVALDEDSDQVGTPQGFRGKPGGGMPALSSPSESKLEQIKSPLIGTGRNSIDRPKSPNGIKGGLESGIQGGSKLDSGKTRNGDPGKTPNGSVSKEVQGSVRLGLSVITPDESVFQQMPRAQTPPPVTPPGTPPPEMLQPLPSRKWKDDGVLRLRKVHCTAQAFS